MDDDEITICSDDFLMDADDELNDSVTILKDFDPDFVNDDKNLGDDNSTSKGTNKEEFEYIQTMNLFSKNNDDNFDEIQNNIRLNDSERETMTDINISKEAKNDATKHSQNIDKYFEYMGTSFEKGNNAKKADQDHKTTDNVEMNDVTFGYSQSIDYVSQNRELSQNNTKKVDQNPKPTDEIQFNDVSFGYSQSIDYVSQNRELSQNNTKKVGHNPKITHDIEINDSTFRDSQNNDYLPQNKELSHSENEINEANKVNKFSNAENMSQNSEKPNQLAIITSANDSSDDHRREEEEEFESEEIISYKVLEEFNKVKSFLKRQNRRMSSDGYSTDSGYRSDSQRSNNRSALQLSGNWLNQSGCCLFNYIMQCHLVATTRDITNEIAQVLSQLIDRLHEEEKYPSFLEDLLETVDLLLRQIYEGDSSDDGEFLKKDEKIQRILLLNKSFHIQKHCLEKITDILEHFHTNVTEIDSTFELSNIDQIENITYIFHILEILLKKYLRNRQILSQVSTQNSQNDEKALKKSSISDIWRKKWNPSQKVFEGSREKKCVLKNCSEILNKIVVDCVSNYSLIAYSALKCFNSMQN
ncbi:hypothetical protein PYW08_012198 [Mythimna loreyi]|uniref:Uncharacterized protein n=1 Tax=Mythimna loreyi TaxID=667449 RepID=A0ACC2PZM7_9NEOP|nr:hypothetical protein PYW08_012198 [Mythimna loreyi]